MKIIMYREELKSWVKSGLAKNIDAAPWEEIAEIRQSAKPIGCTQNSYKEIDGLLLYNEKTGKYYAITKRCINLLNLLPENLLK